MQTGALAVFSPTALTPDVSQTVQAMGNDVQYLVASDFEHHIFLSEWAKAFPSAKVLGVEGLPEKRESNPETRGTKFDYVWTAKNKSSMKVDEAFDRDFDTEYVDGHKNKELVFNYKPEKTLIEADLMFNLPATEQYSKSKDGAESGVLTKLFVGLMSATGKATWQKRFLWYAASSGARESFNQSARRINGWDFDKIIPCHGDVIESNAKGIFRNVLEWHLQGSRKSG